MNLLEWVGVGVFFVMLAVFVWAIRQVDESNK